MSNKRTAPARGTDALIHLAKRHRFVGRLEPENRYVNLAGNYDYLSQPYYVSQDRELSGDDIMPTCKEMLDAYVPPLFLEKARAAGVPVPECYISNGYFEPPAIVDPINPFTLKGRVVLKAGRARSIAKSLTRNFTYAICCQELPSGSRVAYFRSVLGWCAQPGHIEQSRVVWEIFKIPLARVRVITLGNGDVLLSDISPLFFEDLRPRELRHIQERVTWHS